MSAPSHQSPTLSNQPFLALFRTTPPGWQSSPPLISSLQSFESTLLLIALKRFPAAQISCTTAWESAIKAAYKVDSDSKNELYKLVKRVLSEHPEFAVFSEGDLKDFRSKRNHLAHYGYSPEDDAPCAKMLLEIGIPFLRLLYSTLFSFYLDWRDISPAKNRFEDLTSAEMCMAGLHIDVAEMLRCSTRVFNRTMSAFPESKVTHCWKPLIFLLRRHLHLTHQTLIEERLLDVATSTGGAFALEQEEKERLESSFSGPYWSNWMCPFCGDHDTLVAELDRKTFESKEIRAIQGACVHCGFVARADEPFVLDTLLEQQIEEARPAILAEWK